MTHPTDKLRGSEKLKRIPIPVTVISTAPLVKPDWIRVKLPADPKPMQKLFQILEQQKLHTVCQEASCPNLPECFSQGTATFMIMGDKCTRRCAFCDVAHGRPDPLDPEEPLRLARTVAAMGLRYVVITSVDRDDLRDAGASHFVACIQAVRQHSPECRIEVLVPDFRGRMQTALEVLAEAPADVFNHNLETVPRLYRHARSGADYQGSLHLLQAHKQKFPHIPTKSGLMLGLGETDDEIRIVLQDLRNHQVDMLTLGQYLAPSNHHLTVERYVSPETFNLLAEEAKNLGFTHVASGPLVRSSYHADQQAAGLPVR